MTSAREGGASASSTLRVVIVGCGRVGAGLAERLARLGHDVTIRTDLLQARDVGAALVDEAAELDADLILLGLPYRKRFGGDFALGRTVPYVFQNAPCQVIVVREPVAGSEQRAPYRSAVAPGRIAR